MAEKQARRAGSDMGQAADKSILKRVHAEQNRLERLQSEARSLDCKIAKARRDCSRVNQEAVSARAELSERITAALQQGHPVPEIDAELATRLQNAGPMTEATERSISCMSDEMAVNKRHQDDSQAIIAGGIFDYTGGLQAETRAKIVEKLNDLLPLLSELMAIDLIREKYCLGSVRLHQGSDRPWSGTTLTNNLLSAIPERFRPPDLNGEELRRRAASHVPQIILQIEGDLI